MSQFSRESIKIIVNSAREKGQRPNFKGADLSRIDLNRTDLSRADLREVNFQAANLIEANLGEVDLSQADLSQADLIGANLQSANLTEASLQQTNLINTNLVEARLIRADLQGADLSGSNLHAAQLQGASLARSELIGANLMGADLSQANLNGVDLSGASLIGSDLRGTDLSSARLVGADLSEATFGYTNLANIDLRRTTGLDLTIHHAPSTIDLRTLHRSKGAIAEPFLIGCGVPDDFLAYAATLQAKDAPYHTCFLSYAEADETLALKLFTDLQSHGIRCWLTSDEMKQETDFLLIDDPSVRIQDKLLLLFSDTSLAGDWIAAEVEAALHRERRLDEIVLFPLRLDEALLNSQAAWAAPLQNERNIHDFSGWQNDSAYQKSFARLLRHLNARHK